MGNCCSASADSSRSIRGVLFFVIVVLLVFSSQLAQADNSSVETVNDDSTSSDLSEIVVLSRRIEPYRVGPRYKIGADAIEAVDSATLFDIVQLAPATHLQTNSRGEKLVYLRNSGERNVAVFFNGALLNIPWDNRVDLSQLPNGAVGEMTVNNGTASVVYGANVLGGIVNFTPRSALNSPPSTELSLHYGSANLVDASFIHSRQVGGTGLLIAGGYGSHDDVPLSGGANLRFNQLGSSERTNTDADRWNLLLGFETEIGSSTRLNLNLLYVDTERGIAPEGHKDPNVSNVRFWRYPDSTYLMGILSGEGEINSDLSWEGTVWIQRFDQEIDSFSSINYDNIEERQKDENYTQGLRLILSRTFGNHELLASVNALKSTHKQQDIEFENNRPVAGESFPRLLYRENIVSGGLEYRVTPWDNLALSLGAGVDRLSAPRTGDKPDIDNFSELNFTASASYRINERYTLHTSFARKSRMPTLRELFGQAINRFLINPDLEPESAMLADIGLEYIGSNNSFTVTAFASSTSDTIDQRNVVVDGRSLRQRVNIDGTRILGVEASGQFKLEDSITFTGHITAMDVERDPDFPGDFTGLTEKPEVIARFIARYQAPGGLSAAAELLHTGRAYSLNDEDQFVSLNRSTAVNLRFSYDLSHLVPGSKKAEAFIRINNLSDTLVEPQIGLPSAGRWVKAGFNFKF